MIRKCMLTFFSFVFFYCSFSQQRLTLRDAIDLAVKNYPTIKAKNAYAQSSLNMVAESKREYLPNINFGAQNFYGTINSQYGPSYGFGGLGVASAGPTFDKQNWNAAFGALYLANVNWDFYSFGKAKERTKVAQSISNRDVKDYDQEIFQHKVRVASAYLNLVAAHQLNYSYRKNLARTDSVRQLVLRRAVSGLVPGVDSSQANAEYSSAKILLTQSIDNEEQQKNNLSLLIGVDTAQFDIDTTFIADLPQLNEDANFDSINHPVLQYYKSRIAVSNEQSKLLKTQYWPTLSLVGVLQTRGSGFGDGYASDPNDYTHDYWNGIKPARGNYLIGLGITWNITQPFRLSKSVAAQKWQSEGLLQEYNLANSQIKTQMKIADDKMANALTIYNEAPNQVKAASDAFNRQSVLYKNGLTNMVSVTQASYDLIRAETDRDIANNNVWQALLLKAAALGNFEVFGSQLH